MNSPEDILKKNKFLVIQEAKQEINQLMSHYKLLKNKKFDIDILKITKYCNEKFLDLTKSNPNEPHIIEILNDITITIKNSYNHLCNRINSRTCEYSSLKILEKIINIIKNPEEKDLTNDDDENIDLFTINSDFNEQPNQKNDCFDINNDDIDVIQQKINKILDNFHEKPFFNFEKLRNISKSNTKLSEILTSLQAIARNPKLHFEKYKNPEFHVLSSEQNKKFSKILKGNCLFVSLFGQKNFTQNILSALLNDKTIRKHKIDGLITVYGPIELTSFSKNVKNSFEKLKEFNICSPNLYFFEISNEETDSMIMKWCNFISHVTIFCSEKVPTEEEIVKFKELMLNETSNSTLINCSPVEKIFEFNFNTDPLNDESLRDSIFEIFIQKVDQIIPCETAEKYSEIIFNPYSSFMFSNVKDDFENDRIDSIAIQILNKSIEKVKKMKDQIIHQIYSMTQENKFICDFNLNEKAFIDKVEEFFYVNINKNYWDDSHIKEKLKILISEAHNEIDPLFHNIKMIEKVNQFRVVVKEKPEFFLTKQEGEIIDLLTQIHIKPRIPKTEEEINEFQIELTTKYDELIDLILKEEKINSISRKLYEYLNENPIASDQEYGQFYLALLEKNAELFNDSFELIRKVNIEYQLKSFTIDFKIKIQSGKIVSNLNLPLKMTCHELYDYVKKKFNLEGIEFYIERQIHNKNSGQTNYVPIFQSRVPIYKLKTDFFRVFYFNGTERSTKSFLESLIVEKEVQIADDFLIQSSSKEANFVVEYQNNHDGWFDVEFDITSPNPEVSFGEECGVLVFLKLNENERAIANEGYIIVLQNFSEGRWLDECDPVFLTFPDCKSAVVLIRMCAKYRIHLKGSIF